MLRSKESDRTIHKFAIVNLAIEKGCVICDVNSGHPIELDPEILPVDVH